MLLRNPCKNLKSYDNPFWGKSKEGTNTKKKIVKIPKIVVSLSCSAKPLVAHNTLGPKFPLTPMGVLAPGSAHARPSAQPPIDVSGNFSAHVSAE